MEDEKKSGVGMCTISVMVERKNCGRVFAMNMKHAARTMKQRSTTAQNGSTFLINEIL